MKILLVRPAPEKETIGLQHVMLVEPLELEVLATVVEDNHDPVVVDMILEKAPLEYFLEKYQPDLFCVTGYITNVKTMIEYCARAKKFAPQIVTVAGGVHVEVVPEDLHHIAVDYRVVRNATTVFTGLISYLEGQGEKPKAALAYGENPGRANWPSFDFTFPRVNRTYTGKYRDEYFYIFHNKVALVKTAFGCPYNCNFCFCRSITDDNFAQRPLEDIISEIKDLEEKEIYIVDDDFLVSPSRLGKFLDALEKENIEKNFLIYGRSDFIVEQVELIKRFRRLGLKTIIVGLESFNKEELDRYNKNNSPATNEKAIKLMNSLGIDCFATVIIPPHWKAEDFDQLGDKLIELDIKYVNLQPLTPIPGTGFEVEPEKLLIHRSDYASWDLAHVAIRPEHLSVSEFYRQIIKLYERILFRPAVLLSHLKYPPSMLWKMLKGSYLVHRQYLKKMKEAGNA
ncbi:MAG: B12-binding domain-containing radical SAM protein [Deltaproteobacteria bacterium]|jgi:radical SAM superfamily enzyme YgiQ (UPF0313 family)|nr:B12-binding domain-containing radical SAM protein [Deltaproteobacteria bacterium]